MTHAEQRHRGANFSLRRAWSWCVVECISLPPFRCNSWSDSEAAGVPFLQTDDAVATDTYSTASVPGFNRVTVENGNDLAGQLSGRKVIRDEERNEKENEHEVTAWDTKAQDCARAKRQVVPTYLVHTESSCRQTAPTFSHRAEIFRTVFAVVAIYRHRQRRLHRSSPFGKRRAAHRSTLLVCVTLDAHDGAPWPAAARSLRTRSYHTFQYRGMTHGTGTTQPSKKPYRAMISIRFIIFAMIQCLVPDRCAPSEDHGA